MLYEGYKQGRTNPELLVAQAINFFLRRRLICLCPRNGTSCYPSYAKNFEMAARFLDNMWTVAVTISLAAVGPILVSHYSFRYISQTFLLRHCLHVCL